MNMFKAFDKENLCKGITVRTEEKKRSVLIVDDEEAILFAFKDVLSGPWLRVGDGLLGRNPLKTKV